MMKTKNMVNKNNKSELQTDVLIVGTGIAGLICALNIPQRYKVMIISKKNAEDSNSYLAAGGICVQRDNADRDLFIEETCKAGHYYNDTEAVEILVDESRAGINDLISYGVPFDKTEKSLNSLPPANNRNSIPSDVDNNSTEYSYTREGGHSISRIMHCADHTGKSIMQTLLKVLQKRANITLVENCEMTDLLTHENICYGIECTLIQKENNSCTNACNEDSAGSNKKTRAKIWAKQTVLATGGVGGLYKNSTNFRHITGDSLALALKYNIQTEDMEFVQFHPTGFYEKNSGRRFLISEAVRGEGAHLLNKHEERFIDELQPRDIVSQAIWHEMSMDHRNFEWLDMSPIEGDLESRFPMIYEYLLEKKIDPYQNYIPIVPTQHFMMGGIDVDTYGKTSMDNMFAVGEVACTGVHGANRLASNSLLESVVFGKRTGKFIGENLDAENNIPNRQELNKKSKRSSINKNFSTKPIQDNDNHAEPDTHDLTYYTQKLKELYFHDTHSKTKSVRY